MQLAALLPRRRLHRLEPSLRLRLRRLQLPLALCRLLAQLPPALCRLLLKLLAQLVVGLGDRIDLEELAVGLHLVGGVRLLQHLHAATQVCKLLPLHRPRAAAAARLRRKPRHLSLELVARRLDVAAPRLLLAHTRPRPPLLQPVQLLLQLGLRALGLRATLAERRLHAAELALELCDHALQVRHALLRLHPLGAMLAAQLRHLEGVVGAQLLAHRPQLGLVHLGHLVRGGLEGEGLRV